MFETGLVTTTIDIYLILSNLAIYSPSLLYQIKVMYSIENKKLNFENYFPYTYYSLFPSHSGLPSIWSMS